MRLLLPLVLLALLVPLAGCLGGGPGLGGAAPDCRPRVVVGWTSVAAFDAMGEAGVEAAEPGEGLPIRAPALDAAWRGHQLRGLWWDPDLNDEGKRERDADLFSVDQVEHGSTRVTVGMSVSARKSEEEARARDDEFMRDHLGATDEAALDDLFSRLWAAREPTGIMHPDSPAREVTTQGSRAESDLTLRLSELDAALSARWPPQDEHAGFGHATRKFPRWTFSFDVPTRVAERTVDGVPVRIETDGAGWGLASTPGEADAERGLAAIRGAFEALRVPMPEVDASRVHVLTPPC